MLTTNIAGLPTRRSSQEINDLKRDWESDPCWDIEQTEGFEAHKEELLAYRLREEAAWQAQCQREDQERRTEQRKQWGAEIPDAALDYIAALEARLLTVEEKVSLIKSDALYKE